MAFTYWQASNEGQTSPMDPTITPGCPICRQGDEAMDHLFATCTFAPAIWDLLPFTVTKPIVTGSIAKWLWQEASTDNRHLGITLMWYIWKARNNYIFQYLPMHPLDVKARTIMAIFDWNLSHVCAWPSSIVSLSTDWWLLPPPGWCKLNFDGAYNADIGKAGISGPIRNEYGNMILAYTAEVHANHPLEAELIALQRGLIHLSEISCPAIQVGGDYLSLVTKIRNSSHLSWWDMMPLWRHTMHLLSEV